MQRKTGNKRGKLGKDNIFIYTENCCSFYRNRNTIVSSLSNGEKRGNGTFNEAGIIKRRGESCGETRRSIL